MSILLNFPFSGKEATRKTERFFCFSAKNPPIYVYKRCKWGGLFHDFTLKRPVALLQSPVCV